MAKNGMGSGPEKASTRKKKNNGVPASAPQTGEAKAKSTAIESKDSKELREKLDSALEKLKKIAERLPENGTEGKRAQHIIASVEGALQKADPETGMYSVEVKGEDGNVAYVQEEGIPVDGMISMLREEAKRIWEEQRQEMIRLKKERDRLWEKYYMANEMGGMEDSEKYKHTLHDEYIAADKQYRRMEEMLDTGAHDGAEFDKLAGVLTKESQSYWEAHFQKESGEHLTPEEQSRQHLRTRHEALLVARDYRGEDENGNPRSADANYQVAMKEMDVRRELVLKRKKEEKTIDPEPVKTPDPIPEKPRKEEREESDQKEPDNEDEDTVSHPELKKPGERVAFVSAEDILDRLAYTRAGEALREKMETVGVFKKAWMHVWEEAYKQQFIAEEKKTMLGQGSVPGFFKKMFFGARTIEATGKKDLYAGHSGESQRELEALVERMLRGELDTYGGEKIDSVRNADVEREVNALVTRFATDSGMSVDDLVRDKDKILARIDPKLAETLTADNLIQLAEQYRAFAQAEKEAGRDARLDVKLSIELGVAKSAIKTKANLSWVDKVVHTGQKYFGPAVSPEAVGIGISIGSFFAKKPLYWLGGAAGVGGVLGAMRKNKEQKLDLELHRAQRAMGDAAPIGKERRGNFEKFVYDMRSASDIVDEVKDLTDKFRRAPSNKEEQTLLMRALAEAEARQKLSGERSADLISYQGDTQLERGRSTLLRTIAEAKVAIREQDPSFRDIQETEEFKSALQRLSDQMDAVDSSEKGHRWSENAKAAVIGAIGGLAVGGAVQEAAAYTGDVMRKGSTMIAGQLPSMAGYMDRFGQFLRPGGKLTSAEQLLHYIKGDLPVNANGAGMKEMICSAISKHDIELNGALQLVKDEATGLTAVVDKANPSHILAQVNIDSTGNIIPVPGSYDPTQISFGSRTVSGGPRSIMDFLTSMKGKWGGNVAESIWHRGGAHYLDNDTVGKFDFNELRMHMSYDKAGNLIIDASKLQEWATNAATEQTQGSAHADTVLKVAEEFTKGNIKIGIVPDGSQTTAALELRYEPGTHHFVAKAGSDITKFFGVDAKGNPTLLGNGFMGIAHEVGVNKDGSKVVEWVNSIRGNGQPIPTGEANRIIHEICRAPASEQSWWGPWIWFFGRKPLEGRGRQEPMSGDNGNNIKDIIEGKPEDEGKPIKEKVIKKTTVDTRGQKITADRKDWGTGYPENFKFANEKEMAEMLVSRGRFFLDQDDRKEYESLTSEPEKIAFLERRIQEDRELLKISNKEGITREGIVKIVDSVYAYTDEMLAKYGNKGRAAMPAKDKIHVVGAIEYQAQTKRLNDNTLGLCFWHSGELFVNFDMVKACSVQNGVPNTDLLFKQLKRTISHEIVHDSVASNYWAFDTADVGEVSVIRRSGLTFERRQSVPGGSGQQYLVERGRALNEAVTEVLGKEAVDSLYTAEGIRQPKGGVEPYSAERDILALLQQQFGISFQTFARAAVNRKSLRQLADKLEGRSKPRKTEGSGLEAPKRERPQFMSLLLSIMDYEFSKGSREYPATRNLILGHQIVVTKDMKRRFASSLLNETGLVKETLAKQYRLLDQQTIRSKAA